MQEDVIFRYKNGRIIPIKVNKDKTTNEYMNDKLRNTSKRDKVEEEIKYQETDSEEYDKKTQELLNEMTEEEKESIVSYVGIGHKEINQTLEYGEPKEKIIYSNVDDIKNDIRNIDNVMNKSTLDRDTLCWRGDYIIDFDKYAIGDTFTVKSYLSTSLKEKLAVQWAKKKGDGGSVIEIKAPKNTNAIYAGDNFTSQNEFELIIDRNINYKLKDIKDINDPNYGYYKKYIVEIVKK